MRAFDPNTQIAEISLPLFPKRYESRHAPTVPSYSVSCMCHPLLPAGSLKSCQEGNQKSLSEFVIADNRPNVISLKPKGWRRQGLQRPQGMELPGLASSTIPLTQAANNSPARSGRCFPVAGSESPCLSQQIRMLVARPDPTQLCSASKSL